MLDARRASLVAVAVILGALLLAGPSWAEATTLGEGTAEVEVVAPEWLDEGSGTVDPHLEVTRGRFGTAATYLRTPDLVVDVGNVSGRPAVTYDLAVPALGVDRPPVQRRIAESGRYRLHMPDVALPPPGYTRGGESPPPAGNYTGHVTVRVQSFSGDHVVANRTVEVRIDR